MKTNIQNSPQTTSHSRKKLSRDIFASQIQKGYISIHRKIRDHWLWKDPVKFQWWIDLLLEVNHKPDHYNIDGKLILCGRGQGIKSIKSWAERWNTDRNIARKFLRLLESDKMISIETMKRTSRVTILNYNLYQNPRTLLLPYESDNCKDAVPYPYPTCNEKRTLLLPCESESYRDTVPYLDKFLYPNRIRENSYLKGKCSSENISSPDQDLTSQNVKVADQGKKIPINGKKKSAENLDEKFKLFLDSEETQKIVLSKNRAKPYDYTH
ncbi:hypothetical protein ES705_15664 [subsurface metagenome]